MFVTEELYNTSSYIKEFSAEVLDCQKNGEHYEIVLNRTAFFPEGGGQRADTGLIGNAKVIDVQKRNGIIYHITEAPLEVGSPFDCKINFDERFAKMQNHTGEHIMCGIIHSLYGYDNVGFHLGDDYMTFDIDGELSEAQLEDVEARANRAVWENRSVSVIYPTPNELCDLEYRAKLDLVENVRIVCIDGYDKCACCAPHVASTGEIGIIKITDRLRYKGGTRIFAVCGGFALKDYAERISEAKGISARLSVPQKQLRLGVDRLCDETISLKRELNAARHRIALGIMSSFKKTDESLIVFTDLEPSHMREIVNCGMGYTDKICAVFSGNDSEGYKYIIGSSHIDLKAHLNMLNEAIGGKGGGSSQMLQGSTHADRATIASGLSALKLES